MSSFDLRPMEWSEILDRSFTVYRKTFFLLYLLYLLPQVVVWFVQVLTQRQVNELTSLMQTGAPQLDQMVTALAAAAVPLFILMIVALLGSAIQLGSMTLAVSHALFDQPVSMGEAYVGALHRLPSLVIAAILTGLAVFGGCLMFCVPGILLKLAFYVVVPAIVIDGVGGFAALGRSWELLTYRTPGATHPMLKAGIIGFLVFALQMIIGFVASLPTTVATMFLMFKAAAEGGPPPDPTTFTTGIPFVVLTMTGFFQTLIISLVPPFAAIATVLLFYDLKMRREGFDLHGEPEPTL